MGDRRLMKCPFCGNSPKIRKKNRTVIAGKTVRNTYIYCPRCDCRGARVLYSDFETMLEAEEKAIELWNRRTADGM